MVNKTGPKPKYLYIEGNPRRKNGDHRGDGFIFWSYYKKEGKEYEKWMSSEVFQRNIISSRDRRNESRRKNGVQPRKTVTGVIPKIRRKYGDIREDGFIFNGYRLRASTGKYYECWLQPEKYDLEKSNRSCRSKVRSSQQRRTAGIPKRIQINRLLQEIPKDRHHKGDIRSDGRIFWSYRKCTNGFRESWLLLSAFNKANKAVKIGQKKRRVEKKVEDLAWHRDYSKKKRVSDPIYRLTKNMRSRLVNAVRGIGWKKSRKTEDVLGCTYDFLVTYLETQFLPGMTWDNYKYEIWHVDHIIPLSSASHLEEIYQLSHYSNLRPLWAKDNQSKSDRLPNGSLARFKRQ